MKRKVTKIEQLLADNLRRERIQRNWSRKDLARRAEKLQEAVIIKTESLISFPTPSSLIKIAKALCVEPYELLMPEKDLNLIRAVKGTISDN